MINNVGKIKPLLKFPKETSFYFVQILQRRKENPDLQKNAVNVDNFFIYNLEDFDKYLPRIVSCCNRFNARAYIRLNIRDAEVIAQRATQKSFELIINKQFKQVKNAYLNACGEYHSDDDKTWVIDLDCEDKGSLYGLAFEIAVFIRNLREESKQDGNALIEHLETKNGLHLITRPFRLDKFKEKYPGIDVHKDNPTILYAP